MAALLEKPEDHIKYRLGDLIFNNIFLSTENERLTRELDALKEANEKSSK